jgi:archaellum component FlaF (FlaF/FlaG flagellin family)
MESAIASLILFTVGIFAALTISHTFLQTQDSLWVAEQTRQEDILQRERTDLEITGAETQGSGSIVRVKVRNSGQVKLTDFDRWDVVVQYYADGLLEEDPNIYHVDWLPYTEGNPGNMQWSVSGIYVDADAMTPEVFEPGILNPDEEMVIQARVLPTVAMTTTNLITINTLNGISTSSHFMR